MSDASPYDFYKSELSALHQKLVGTLGAVAVCQLLRRSLVEASATYPALGLIRVEEDGLTFTDADPEFSRQPAADVQAAFSAFYAVTIVLLARILGKEVAVRLADNPSAEGVLEGNLIGG
jgi:hypothetical protein